VNAHDNTKNRRKAETPPQRSGKTGQQLSTVRYCRCKNVDFCRQTTNISATNAIKR